MKKLVGLGLIISALAFVPQQAQAWTNFKFGVGLNLEWSSGNNSLLWGAWHDGLRHGPAVPHYNFNPFNCFQGGQYGYGYPNYGGYAYGGAPAAPAAPFPSKGDSGTAKAASYFTHAYYQQPYYYPNYYQQAAYSYYQPVGYYGYGYGNYGYGW